MVSDKDVLQHRSWNQQLRRKTSRLLNTLEARLCRRDTVVDRIFEEFCEALPGGH
jgi:hypothetical protein